MKKLSIIAFAALLVVAFTAPTYAIEHVFGGYWRTRFYSQGDFSGQTDDVNRSALETDPETGLLVGTSGNIDTSRVDTRTRLYYTAKFSDNFKFVNKFEMDAVWGEDPTGGGYGDIGADGIKVEVKNSYIDWMMGPHDFRVGVQDFLLAKGFLFSDDAAGAKLIFNVAEGIYLPLIWVRFFEGGSGEFYSNFTGSWRDNNDGDVDALIFYPSIYLGKNMKLYPHVAFLYSDQIQRYPRTAGLISDELAQVDVEARVWSVGVEWDHSLGAFNYGLTGIWEFGDLSTELYGDDVTVDVKGWLVSATAGFDLGMADVHGEFTYASGDDTPEDSDFDAFLNLPGASYYWSEIMGYGMFDNQVSNGSPADQISNIWFANVGAGFKPMDKLKLKADLWYAELVEEDAAGETELGFEVDLRATYMLVDGLNLDLVGAYLFAGDATGTEDPWEVGAQLSLSF